MKGLTRFMPRSERGFTLVEMIVTTAIVGLLALGMISFYLWGVHSWQKNICRMDEQQSARIAMDQLVRDLSFASYYELRPSEVEFRFQDDAADLFRRYRLKGREIVLETGTRRKSNYRVNSHLKIAQEIGSLSFSETGDMILITITTGPAEKQSIILSGVRPRNM